LPRTIPLVSPAWLMPSVRLSFKIKVIIMTGCNRSEVENYMGTGVVESMKFNLRVPYKLRG